ncbi:hypothetical protein GCM10027093_62480 [Paraburkholderia jirisanensis]
MTFKIGNVALTAWSLNTATYAALKPYVATIDKFLTPKVIVQFDTVQNAVTALADQAALVAFRFEREGKPLAPVTMSIAQCVNAVEHAVSKSAYNEILTAADAKGASVFTAALKNNKASFAAVTCVFFYQAAFMSGDQFAVGAALAHDATSRLILFFSENEIAAAKRLVTFYAASCGVPASRLLPVQVDSSRAACDTCEGVVDARINSLAYPTIADAKLQFLTSIPRKLAMLCPVGGATTTVAASVLVGDGKENIAKWANVDPNKNRYWGYRIDKFLNRKGVEKDQKYVIVWTRFSGADGGAHPELDDTWTGLIQVCDALLKKRLNVIVVGRPRSNTTIERELGVPVAECMRAVGAGAVGTFDIWGEYWKLENGSPNKKIIGPNRAAEYAIFLRMCGEVWNCGIVHLGMRSGAMDAAALLGMRTRFIEDVGNRQIARTTKWTGDDNSNALYQRIPVKELSARAPTPRRVPGASGRQRSTYLAEDVELIVRSVESALA